MAGSCSFGLSSADGFGISNTREACQKKQGLSMKFLWVFKDPQGVSNLKFNLIWFMS